MSERIRSVIADDEPAGRRNLHLLLAKDPDIRVVGDARTGQETAEAVLRLRPDLLFLDVQMPGGDGFAALADIPPEAMPLVIFVTAFDSYSLRAFDARALDYLMKPFTDQRFRAAVSHAKERLRERRAATEAGTAASATALREAPAADRLAIRTSQGIRLLALSDVDWIEARGDYVRIYSSDRTDLVREPIGDLAERLAPQGFVRIHRSAVVNLSKVREVRSTPDGEHVALLRNGVQCRVSRSGRERIEAVFGRPL